MRRVVSITALSLAVLATTGGCVQQDAHDRTLVANRTLQEQLRTTQRDMETAQANLTTAKAEIGTLQAQMGKLEGEIGTQAARSSQMLNRVRQLGPLPIDLELALDQVAATHPDLLTFDSRQGMLRFSSDFSFDSGSVELRPEAASTIAVIAEIINGTEAESFEIHLIGHTDNVPIGKPGTRQQHPTNLRLFHRASPLFIPTTC
jgi:flagellar motor protein MotB